MSESLKSIIIASVLLIILAGTWFLFLYQPEVSKLQLLKEKTEDVLLQLQSLRVTDEQLNALEQKVAVLRAEIATAQSRIMPKNDLPAIVDKLRRKGERYGMKFNNIIPDYNSLVDAQTEEQAETDILQLTIHLKMQGYYKNLGRFIESLEDMPVFVSVGELSINYQEKVHPELEIFLDVIVFLKDANQTTTTI